MIKPKHFSDLFVKALPVALPLVLKEHLPPYIFYGLNTVKVVFWMFLIRLRVRYQPVITHVDLCHHHILPQIQWLQFFKIIIIQHMNNPWRF